MSGSTRTVGERGQVTIPKWLRDQLGIRGGDEVSVREYAGGVLIRKQPSEDELAEAYRRNAERARRVNEQWESASQEADEYL